MAWCAFTNSTTLGNRIGLASEPGCGFSQNFALDLELSVLLAKPCKLLMLVGRQAVAAAPGVQIGLFDPVANRLPRALELRREVMYAANPIEQARRSSAGSPLGRGGCIFWPWVDLSPPSGKYPRNRASFKAE